jgi:hypothetical protein
MTTVLSESISTELSLDELQTILTYWSQDIEQRPFTEEETNDCLVMIQQSGQSMEWWLEHLIRIPDEVENRYRKVIGLLLEKGKIDQQAHDEELKNMHTLSPATMTRQGKVFAEWLRRPEERFYS